MEKERAAIVMIVIAGLIFLIGEAVQGKENQDKTLSPYFLIQTEESSEDHFPLKSTDVRVNISGVIADVTVVQVYENRGTQPIHAGYIFPASTRAAVHGMTMKIGDRIIRAKVKEKEAAKKTFETAKKQGKSATLLEQQRPNVFGMNVANIMPGDIIEIELSYTELLVPAEGIYEFVYPTVVGPRYSGQTEAAARESDKWVKNPYLENGAPVFTAFDIHVSLSTGLPIQDVYCRTHDTVIDWNGETEAGIRLVNAGDFGGNRDYILNYRLTGTKIESGLMLYEGEDEHFFLLMVEPPERVRPEEILAREYVFVVDVSGSMNGFPLNTAKRLLFDVISGLKPTDTFNVVLFAGSSRSMADASVPASPAHIQQAILLLDRERGGGGTELCKALHRAMQLPRDEARSRTLVIVTDGYIRAEHDVFELIQENLNQTNVFAFGIGSGVNRYLIEGMAKAGRGEPFIVTDMQQAAGTANAFREYISTPVLTGASLRFDGFDVYDVEPPEIPDLFTQRPVIVFGKYRGKAEGKATLTGNGGQGIYKQVFDISEIKPKEVNRAQRYLWVRSRIARLSDFGVGRPDPDLKDEITGLGLTYNLLTPYTSFIAVLEEVRNPEGAARNVKQPLPLPEGVSNLAVGEYAMVPEPELLYLALGMFVVLILSRRKKGITR